jgi:hypothetical protein
MAFTKYILQRCLEAPLMSRAPVRMLGKRSMTTSYYDDTKLRKERGSEGTKNLYTWIGPSRALSVNTLLYSHVITSELGAVRVLYIVLVTSKKLFSGTAH